ncbi:MAG TPA: endonuclease NucS [Actinomycetota bacterium]|jgi:endonuclease
MRLVIARCSIDYAGRLDTHLPAAVRLLIVKADGSVLVHADGGGYRPLNWMSAPCTLAEEPAPGPAGGGEAPPPGARIWRVANRTGESMTITIEEVLHDSAHRLGLDPGLVKDGVEKHLQELLAERCQVLGDGWTLVRREYPTDIGPVDLLCRDEQGRYVAVEIKRRGEIDGVEQLSRYLQRLGMSLGGVRGVFAALAFRPQARVLAADRDIACVQLDYDALRGMEPRTPTLF